MSDQLIPLNILIGDRTYRIKSLAKDEQHIRQTLKVINDKIVEYKTQFAGKDMQDYIAMVLIWLATEQPATALSNEDFKKLSEKLKTLHQMVDAALSE